MHADSAANVVYRLENDPINIPRLLLTSLNAVVVQKQTLFKGKRVRRIFEIMEIIGIEAGGNKALNTNLVFRWDNATDKFKWMGNSEILKRFAEKRNMSQKEAEEEWVRRADIIRWMQASGYRTREEMIRIVRLYSTDPAAVARLVKGDLQ
jgi:flagellar protein FlaI